jgi:hypothetical protein
MSRWMVPVVYPAFSPQPHVNRLFQQLEYKLTEQMQFQVGNLYILWNLYWNAVWRMKIPCR